MLPELMNRTTQENASRVAPTQLRPMAQSFPADSSSAA